MHASHTPLTTWFWAAYLMTTQTPGQSALQFQRQLGLTRYETAFGILHKLRAGMVRLERDQIGEKWPVEIDETFIGGKSRGLGSGNHSKVAVVGAVEVRQRQEGESAAATGPDSHKFGVPTKKKIYAGRLRLQVIPDRYAATLEPFVYGNVAPHATVRTDGWRGYNDLTAYGYRHDSMVLDGDPAKADAHLPMIHIVFANLKSWILGTHHGRIEPHHLQAYLNEFVFRFNRRFYPMTAFNSVLGLATQTVGPTYSQLYSGEWKHPPAKVANIC
jgi:hypothetical protein